MKNIRNIMLVVSAVLGIAAALALVSAVHEWNPAYLVAVLVFCIPALYHKFVIPEYPRIRHYFQLAALYLTCWGVPVFLLVYASGSLPEPVGYAYLAALLITWALGAFLPRR